MMNTTNILSELWKARLLLLGAAALYGTNFTLVKLLGENIPVGINSALRFGLATLVSLPWLVNGLGLFNIRSSCSNNNDEVNNNKEQQRQTQKGSSSSSAAAWTSLWLGLEVGLWNSIGYVSQAVGLETTPACESAFICSLAVVVVPLLDCMSGKQLQSKQWIGAILAVVGVAFLELGDYNPTDVDDVDTTTTTTTNNIITWGRILSLTQPFSFGIGFWKMEKAMQLHPKETPRMTAAQLFAIFMASVVYGYTTIDDFNQFPWMEWCCNPDILFGLFWTGVITTALTIYMENLAMKTLSAAETTLIFSTEPLWGAAFAIMFMGEELGWSEGVGAAFISIACIYSNLGTDGIHDITPKIMCCRGRFEMRKSSTTKLLMTKHHNDDEYDTDDDTSPISSDDESSREDDSSNKRFSETRTPTTSKRRVRFTDGLVSREATQQDNNTTTSSSWIARRRPNSPHKNKKSNNVLPRWSEETTQKQQNDRQK